MEKLAEAGDHTQVFRSTGRPGSPDVAAFYEPDTGSWQYVVSDPATRQAAIVDPVLEFDPATGATSTESAERILAYIAENGLEVAWILDTHPHADHFSAAHLLGERLGAPLAIGRRTLEVQKIWAELYAADDLAGQPGHWDRLFDRPLPAASAPRSGSPPATPWPRSATWSATPCSPTTR